MCQVWKIFEEIPAEEVGVCTICQRRYYYRAGGSTSTLWLHAELVHGCSRHSNKRYNTTIDSSVSKSENKCA